MRCSPSNSFSLPPEKKNVTCGYFSVSAILICFFPASETTSANLGATFRLNPAMSAELSFGISRTDEDDADETSRRRNSVGAGLSTELASGLVLAGSLTLDRAETYLLGVEDSSDEGVGLSVSLTQPRPNGEIGLSLTSRVDNSGRRTSANLSRSYDATNGGLSLSLGLVDQEGEDIEVTTGVNYRRVASDRSLSATLVQRPSTSDGEAFLNTSFSLNYAQAINEISSWDAGLSYGESGLIGGASGDSRTSAQISYTRDLTKDWNLRAGLSHVRIEEEGGAERSANSVFVTVGRDINFGF